jgi:hypothetical protein
MRESDPAMTNHPNGDRLTCQGDAVVAHESNQRRPKKTTAHPTMANVSTSSSAHLTDNVSCRATNRRCEAARIQAASG